MLAPARTPVWMAWSVAVSRDHDVDRLRRVAAHVAMLEVQAATAHPRSRAHALRGGVAQRHHVFAQLHAGHAGGQAQRMAQVVVHRERKVALAAAEIEHVDLRRGLQRGRRKCVVQHLDELVDLLPLARHRRHELVLLVGDAQRHQEGLVQVDEAVLGAVVRVARFGRSAGLMTRLAAQQGLLALLADHQLGFLVGAEEVGLQERARKQAAHRRDALGQRQVLRDVARLVGVDEREAGLALQRHLPHRHAHQIACSGPRLGQHEPGQCGRGKGLFEQCDEGVCGGIGHGLLV